MSRTIEAIMLHMAPVAKRITVPTDIEQFRQAQSDRRPNAAIVGSATRAGGQSIRSHTREDCPASQRENVMKDGEQP